ncbi:hypothetical protein [Streptococcus hyovaginalis]|nr:hypothetical protein [Streptococcus hyovaginalis]MDY5974051.1 hypothetical protein [Streptococcus hyovaginalis]
MIILEITFSSERVIFRPKIIPVTVEDSEKSKKQATLYGLVFGDYEKVLG